MQTVCSQLYEYHEIRVSLAVLHQMLQKFPSDDELICT